MGERVCPAGVGGGIGGGVGGGGRRAERVVLLKAVRRGDLERERGAEVSEVAACHGRREHHDADAGSADGPKRQGASAAAAWVGPEEPRSRSAWVACSIHFCASGPLGGWARNSRRCWVAPSGSPRLSRRKASP